ncbi:MAG: polysaccharide biosynthesis tyrosine autokinase, partial [Desulfobulbaceae bacterium]|nr:polysaccharide biosynthesis tyrosine autokinase [Desulfobulbaceae bacterium]
MSQDFQQLDTTREEEINIRDYIHVLLKRRHIAATFFVITFTLVLIKTLAQTPSYEASTQLLIEKNSPVNLTTQYGYVHDPFFLNTQFELIKSKNVTYRVVANLHLDSSYRSAYLDDVDSFSPIQTVKSWLTTAIRFFIPKSPSESDQTQSDDEVLTDADMIAQVITEDLEVKPVRDTNVINITYSHENPVIARMVVNAIAKSYMDELLEIKMQNSSYAVKWMTAKAEEEKTKLRDAESAMQQYTRENDLVTVENKLTIIPQQLDTYSSQLSQARAKRKELEDIYIQIQNLGTNYKAIENLPIFSDNKDLQVIREKILATEQNIGELSKQFGDKHPSMIKAREEIQLLQGEKKAIITRFIESTKNEYELVKHNETNMEQLLDETKIQLMDMNEKLIQHNILKREVDSNRVLYEALLTQIKETSATEQTQAVNVFIMEKANTPLHPASPKKFRNILLAVVFGLFGGCGLAFLVEYLDNTVSSIKDLEERFQLPVLGVVQFYSDPDTALVEVINQKSKHTIAENYRMIRSALMLSSPEKPPKSLLVTSGLPSEGKSSTCINLAKTIALEGKSVLIIDCDLRRPSLHKHLHLNNNSGLSFYLAGMKQPDLIKKIENSAVSVITAGPIPPNPSELLNSKRMQGLLATLSEKFDCILLDSPPILSVTDAHILGTMVDGTILVTYAGKTTYDGLTATLKKMSQVKMHLAGAILNAKDFKKESAGIPYSYYSNYYSHYYSEGYHQN